MGTFICLSSAANLRCESLSRIRSEVLIIPPVLEVIFATYLVAAEWGSGSRKHFLLVAEGWTYFFLALIDLLSHITPAARKSLPLFKSLDIFIASASFLPLLFYTLFLFLFSSEKLIQNLPQRYQRIVKYLIIIFIPTIVALNEINSFVGISRRTLQGSILAIGFRSDSDQAIWTFFSSLTIAILAIYQAINFVLTFYQLLRVFIDKRRIETSESDEAHLFRGIGWIAAGIKLGAIETIVGFAPAGFEGAITRRILRLLGRGCLIIGIVKGMDIVEDFRNLHEELRGQPSRGFRRSRLKPLISNPRSSTFRRLSPTQAAFHEPPRAPPLPPELFLSDKSPSIATFDTRTPTVPGLMDRQSSAYRTSRRDMYQSPSYASPFGFRFPNASPTMQTPTLRPQRVTVNYLEGQAPMLEMRFSSLDMDIPSPSAISENAKFRYPSDASGLSIASAFPNVASTYLQNPPQAMLRPVLARSRTVEMRSTKKHRYKRSNFYTPEARPMSSDSLASDSLEAVRDLAAQFPGLPSCVTGKFHGSVQGDDYEWEDEYSVHGVSRETSTRTYRSERSLTRMVSRSNSLAKRRPPPQLDINAADAASKAPSQNDSMRADAGHEVSHYLQGDGTAASSPYTQVSSSFGFESRRESLVETPVTDPGHNPFIGDDAAPPSSKSQTFASSEYGGGSGESIRSAEWLATASRGQRVKAVDIEAYRSVAGPVSKAEARSLSDVRTAPDKSENRMASPTLSMPWLPNANDVRAKREGWSRNDLARIKSVGSAPRRVTPTPTSAGFSGVSILVERTEADALIKRVDKESGRDLYVSGYAV
ncbi:hypothetical protein PILCRDRAFT_14728 [Piloderma croceum F 1598]|uniref:Uncharacterized protein n=1 Tax=Piloderma croceum (strain F 1598) TaxID=765440 RepID=A0A0C3AJS5_PILCF|nr:hypothetical protein PILCRDRAFT_14728 [Piloderma croceum F 1598]